MREVYVVWYWHDGETWERIHGILETEQAAKARIAGLEANEAVLATLITLDGKPWPLYHFRLESHLLERT